MKSYEKIISERIKEQRKKNSQKQQRVDRLYGIASTLGGIGLLIYALLSYQAVSNLEKKGFSTAGIITKTTTHTSGYRSGGGVGAYVQTSSYMSTIEFQTKQEKIVKFKANDICCQGRKIEILYNPDNPQQAIVKAELSIFDRVKQPIGWGLFLTLVGIGFFAVAEIKYGELKN
ncbi:DUF3592 domain-containing protein [Nostoc sp. FACHB-888]|uniref:DUF3592 domain-containing protein n=1 Tax=Nostoc sp. FACHB-888 TaxID=2692842 RepID=UPI001683E056|nr:DUF3592 domain-containing protein [Nostoc sp. FACHB-888]MBD2248858.1 DUF3592 domain-containing protein [Nostoc sp. FACHB-888]